jgi:outer membrane lipoprotein carrier protein
MMAVSRLQRFLACVSLMLFGAGAAAAEDSIARVDKYFQRLETLSADFVQVVRDQEGEVVDRATGSFSLWRPNRFRWTYLEPYEQTIVADGERLWLYDADLQQVTVRALKAGLGSTPAMLLSGAGSISDGFKGEALETVEGWTWCHLRPRQTNADFERVSLVFAPDGQLAGMELRDKLGQSTHIDFTDLERNLKPRPALYRFEVPEGTDVIGDAGP